MGCIIGSGSRRNQAAWRMWKEKKQKKKENKTKQQKQNKRTEMRTQEQKQYGENGKYSHKCMKQNYNREETEGEELTASGRGGCPWKGRRL